MLWNPHPTIPCLKRPKLPPRVALRTLHNSFSRWPKLPCPWTFPKAAGWQSTTSSTTASPPESCCATSAKEWVVIVFWLSWRKVSNHQSRPRQRLRQSKSTRKCWATSSRSQPSFTTSTCMSTRLQHCSDERRHIHCCLKLAPYELSAIAHVLAHSVCFLVDHVPLDFPRAVWLSRTSSLRCRRGFPHF